ncbi:hypothetical protein HNY73_004107 [Argiope bruennichi]|uniref:Uncharacterized protein n=1 Tax=Argiope bruennichi TaxID=94029 RepID=A0A8T0FUT3_ARGBR|nr:hypothetical protein HNY73_004107 [Argiope bruennichi]
MEVHGLHSCIIFLLQDGLLRNQGRGAIDFTEMALECEAFEVSIAFDDVTKARWTLLNRDFILNLLTNLFLETYKPP